MSLTGKKVKGFKFEDKHSGINYLKSMDRYIGVEGVVGKMGAFVDSYEIRFNDRFNDVSYYYPASLIEKHLVDEFVLPEKWVIRPTNKTEGAAVLKWFNKNGETKYIAGGESNYNWYFPAYSYLNHCKTGSIVDSSYTRITFEQFEQYVLKQEKQEKMEVKKSDLEKIHFVACTEWKGKIEKLTLRNPFGDSIELTQTEVDEMFAAATASQRLVLVDIFGFPTKSIDLSSGKVGNLKLFERNGCELSTLIAVRAGGEFENKAFYLNSDFNWEIGKDENGITCLIPTRK